jgi:alpha/beta superfamily hydrolase
MSTKRVFLKSEYALEGVLRESGSKRGVVICHPHPLYGGSMSNNVVAALEQGFSRKGFATLRFNFRGVGGSDGSYAEGVGEITDVLAALAFLRDTLGSDAPLIVAGYSFGAWVGAHAAVNDGGIERLFLVSYPVAFYSPDVLYQFPGEIYLVAGEFDDIGPLAGLMEVYKGLSTVSKHLKVIPTDHFYAGREREIADFASDAFTLE